LAELVGNRVIEDAAIAWVMELELAAGRQPRDTRHQGAPADVESPPRLIEVKAVGKASMRSEDFLWLEVRQVEEARANGNFCVYVVENVRQSDPAQFRLRVLGGEQLGPLPGRPSASIVPTRRQARYCAGDVGGERGTRAPVRDGVQRWAR
jgi:uncharacterized protein DUF3883